MTISVIDFLAALSPDMQEQIKLHYLSLLTSEMIKQSAPKLQVRKSRLSICKEILQEIGLDAHYQKVLILAKERYGTDIYHYDVANARYALRKSAKKEATDTKPSSAGFRKESRSPGD